MGSKSVNNSVKWWNYYLPLRWTFATRYINVINVISFFIIDAMPSCYVVLALRGFDIDIALYWMLSFYVMFCFYECGYIFNETISVRYEAKPTIRIPEPYFSKILKHVENLLTTRLVLGTAGSWILVSRFPENKEIYVLLLLMLLIAYSLHNFYRSRVNIITMAVEVSLKYMIPISLFVPVRDMAAAFAIIFLTIVFIRLIEYVSKKGFYARIRVTNDVDVFRIRYYALLCLLMAAACYFDFLPAALCGLPLIFLLYRLSTWYLMSHSGRVAEVINRGRKNHGTLAAKGK